VETREERRTLFVLRGADPPAAHEACKQALAQFQREGWRIEKVYRHNLDMMDFIGTRRVAVLPPIGTFAPQPETPKQDNLLLLLI
jgi:hypothetical protein